MNNYNAQRDSTHCWICDSSALVPIKQSNIGTDLHSNAFAITDYAYGKTTGLAKCKNCGFIQSIDSLDVLKFYGDLEDPDYEANRKERALQAKSILTQIGKIKDGARLLDIGAGSGILVEQALKAGFRAEGVEPSLWLQNKALELGLPVRSGVFPQNGLTGPYDVITLIDVIEHVDDPVKLLHNMYEHLAPGGVAVVITPDVGSWAARLLGFRWWHFRIAHIGYFNRTTLNRAATSVGFQPIRVGYAKWYFAMNYLWHRANTYLPKLIRFKAPEFTSSITIPVNLGDSILAIYRKPL